MPPKKKQNGPRQTRNAFPHQPPRISGVVRGFHIFRYKQIEGIQDIDLYADDLAFCMCVANSTSTVTPVWSHFRIDYIHMWAPAQVLSGSVQDPKVSSITWTGDFSPNAEMFSTTNVQTGVATIFARPSRLIEAGKWQKVGQGASANKLVKLRVPDQSVIDIKLSFIYRDEEGTSITISPSSVLVTAGNMYYFPADSYFGSRKLVPMALLTRT